MKKYSFLIFLLLFRAPTFAQWLDSQTVKSTVLIEKLSGDKLLPHGTGFLLYNYQVPEKYICVTCAHLLSNRSEIFVRMNLDSTFSKILQKQKVNTVFSDKNDWIIQSDNLILRIRQSKLSKTCIINDSLDIGAFYATIPNFTLQDDSTTKLLKFADKLGIPKSRLQYRKQMSLGAEVYFIGFPLGFGANAQISPLVRSGSVAWLSESSEEYLLDSFSYGGNSGSPIFTKSLLGTKKGNLSWATPKLVGMIIGHHGMKLENILTQPNPDELKFEKGAVDMNLGLARCLFTDDIMNTVKLLQAQ